MRIKSCVLRVSEWMWPLAQTRVAEIEADWRHRHARTPKMFNGVVYLACSHVVEDASLSAALFKSDFRTLLYWRARADAADEPVREMFGASLIRSAEGHLLMGEQGPGQLNSGRIYPPGGLIDDDDVHEGGIDIDASIVRELGEETGLDAGGFTRVPGYLVVFTGLKISIGIEWRSSLPAAELRERILKHVRRQPDPELANIVAVASQADIDEVRMPPHAVAYVRTLLSA